MGEKINSPTTPKLRGKTKFNLRSRVLTRWPARQGVVNYTLRDPLLLSRFWKDVELQRCARSRASRRRVIHFRSRGDAPAHCPPLRYFTPGAPQLATGIKEAPPPRENFSGQPPRFGPMHPKFPKPLYFTSSVALIRRLEPCAIPS